MRRLGIFICLAYAVLSAGCTRALIKEPPDVTVSEMQPSGRAAKPPNCTMPVLDTDPTAGYRKVAIIDARAVPGTEEKEMLPAVVRKACETGADALVIVTSKAQHSETPEGLVAGGETGYYVSAVAIVYDNNAESPASPPHNP
ncbi:MAG TPA: hypothetical protein VMB26_12940 [Candidatus Binataceae bacterium]|nr:hypothetical protein [Candidatus Binataceae bacterium]